MSAKGYLIEQLFRSTFHTHCRSTFPKLGEKIKRDQMDVQRDEIESDNIEWFEIRIHQRCHTR